MDTTPHLILPYILAAQAQKHVTHNEAIRALDALVHLSALDRNLASPPASPADGARYIVAAAPTGAWAGHAGKVAAFQDGAWEIYTPREGWIAWIADEDVLVAWNGSDWVVAGGGGGGGGATSLNPATGGLVGVNATADATNRLSVSSPASLFNHEGAGHQQKINKAAAANTASQLYQTGFSGRAEIGLTGDDDFHFKVSPDGASWKDAIQINRTTGVVTMPFTSFGGGSGKLLQEVAATYATHSAVTSIIPFDDTIPQSSEGAEVMTAAITPIAATSKIRIWAFVHGGISVADNIGVAVFKDSGANAIAAEWQTVAAGYPTCCVLMSEEAAGSTAARTYKVRAGPRTSGNTLYLNGRTVTPPTGLLFGNVAPCRLLIQEIAA